ncbi:MAG: hypothetical protein FJ038_08860 [Chloroflexi bacterium]|nr:hypothetical protein [Chloroflexota bacterium]
MAVTLRVAIETGSRRVFASALDWPGLARSGRSEGDALAALVAYGDRYGRVLVPSPGGFHAPDGIGALSVVERQAGGPATDFGAPSAVAAADDLPLAGTELERWTAILAACWTAFDRAAEAAAGVALRVGPRGGGRDLERIVAHAVEADEAYLIQLGARPPGAGGPPPERWQAVRQLALATLSARAGGAPPATNVKRPWAPRTYGRRAAWHALDHAWEIEDRAAPG